MSERSFLRKESSYGPPVDPEKDLAVPVGPADHEETDDELAAHRPKHTSFERASFVAGMRAQIARNKVGLADEIRETLVELDKAIKSGAFGEIDAARVAEQLAVLAFLPWRKTVRQRSVLQAQVKALEMLGRYLKMFVDKLEVDDNRDLANRLREALGRVAALAPKSKASRN